MVGNRGEFLALLIGAILLAVAACFPYAFIRTIGAGRVQPSKRGLLFFDFWPLSAVWEFLLGYSVWIVSWGRQ